MASEQDITSDSLDVSVTDVPDTLLDYIKSSIVDCLDKTKFSTKIHHVEGQAPKLVVTFGAKSAQQPLAPSRSNEDLKGTKTIIVKNVPASADEELLEVFFESTKKQGGGPVKSVKILRDKNVAFIEFCEHGAVETVIKKRPIKFGTAELDVEPYKPLLQGSEKINRMDFIGLPGEFTDGLLKKQLDCLLPTPDHVPVQKASENVGRGHFTAPVPDYGPELAALIKVGSRVVRARDWKYGYQDGGGEGTVTGFGLMGKAWVRWDNGIARSYRIGQLGRYEIKLAQ